MNKEEKNKKIAQRRQATYKRHSSMICKTYEIKAVSSKLNSEQKQSLNQYFKEAKWLRNFHIAHGFDRNLRDIKEIEVKVGKTLENRSLSILGSQVKQDIFDNLISELRSLSSNKKQGNKVGKLKYKSVCNMLPLRQYGTTYKIDFYHNRIKVQNIKKPFYVRGLKQIPEDADITNAKLVRKASGLYFYITCYEKPKIKVITNRQIGIDFGIKDNLTLSDGLTFNIKVKENETIKRLSKKLNRAFIKYGKKYSRNHRKLKGKLKVAYEKLTNQKKDQTNKVVHFLLNNYDYIAMQDEMIANWHSGLFGKQVQHSSMGFIKAKLKNSSKVHVVETSFPSTQICPICGSLTKHPLNKRDYDCKACGYHHDSRDIKSAQSILDYALMMS